MAGAVVGKHFIASPQERIQICVEPGLRRHRAGSSTTERQPGRLPAMVVAGDATRDRLGRRQAVQLREPRIVIGGDAGVRHLADGGGQAQARVRRRGSSSIRKVFSGRGCTR